jgi:hypothetical protein
MLEPHEEYKLAKRWPEHSDRDAAQRLVTVLAKGIFRLERWSRNFEQGTKWNLGLTAGILCLRIRSDDEEASPPEPHTGLQGEGGLGCLEE